jgi:hypothetical protein
LEKKITQIPFYFRLERSVQKFSYPELCSETWLINWSDLPDLPKTVKMTMLVGVFDNPRVHSKVSTEGVKIMEKIV